jgi:CheY-like chemotaxis protein
MERAQIILLHAEDNAVDRTLLRTACRKAELPVQIHSVDDGETAEDYLVGNGPYSNRDQYPMPDALLLDLKMPRRNGIQVLDWIRGHPRFKGLIVIVLSALTDPSEVREVYAKGAQGFLAKPQSVEELSGKLQRLFEWLSNIERPQWDLEWVDPESSEAEADKP